MGAARYELLDVFTDTALQGNPLAVFTDGRKVPDELMQRVARELGLSESVFVLEAEGSADARVRIFTPTAELPFAGHPLLGSAILLGAAGGRDLLTLETRAGPVPVALWREGQVAWGRMRQPLPSWEPFEAEAELLAALRVERSLLPVELYRNGPSFVCVALGSELELRALAPDSSALAALGELGVMCFAGERRTWRARMFAPALGVVEDPATGSAAGPLAVHLCRHERISYGEEIEIEQGAEIGRRSLLLARAVGSRELLERVEVAGAAIRVGRGELLLGG